MARKRIERKLILCACGCGELIEHLTTQAKPKRYVRNHHTRTSHQFMDGVEGRVCASCGAWHPLSEYGKHKTTWDRIDHRCKNCAAKRSLRYYHKNKETINAKRKTPEFRKQFNAYWKEYNKKKCSTDVNYRLKRILRSQVGDILAGRRKRKHTLELLGCTVEELRCHLEEQFEVGMSWDNHGQPGWEIDHVRPCASFDLSDPVQQAECFNYTNLQPLWGPDNWAKSAKWKGEEE